MRVLCLLLVVACGSGDTTPTAPGDASTGGGDSSTTPIMLGQPENGRATYYAATGAGNCGFDPTPNDLDVAAMDAPEYDGSAVCGECVQVTGPKGMVTVRIVDQCPGCEMGHLDLSQEAFAKIADVSAGNVPITWEVVACDVQGPIQYHFKDGSSQYWTAIQVRNHKLPIAKLEVQLGGTWTDVPRLDYNYFVQASGVGTTGSFGVRVTSSTGEVLTDTLPGVMANTTVPGAAQFP